MSTNRRPADVPDYRARAALDGQRIVVLGGGAGMGRQTVHALSQLGATVVCVDREQALAETVAAESGAIPMACNVMDPDDLGRCLTAAVTELGGSPTSIVDIIGTAWIGDFKDMTPSDWEFQLDINLRHAVHVANLIHELPELPESLAFVGSISGNRHVPRQGAYGVVKAALHQLVRALADELGPQGVRVNAIAPGWTKTPRLLEKLGEEAWRIVDAEIPRGFAADPSEMAGPLAFLVSPLASYITGQILTVDGGLTNAQATPRVF
ncbi:SDR family oxidoreductase [Dactylosporangium sp. NPDC051484]|uniref:SDR family NAD(P)-dependent oxidoreductase n=1 Tax=Dactylosporangium sp. NPDC051484 TaxID=3154942 RepID=UPI00344B8619